MPLIRELRDEDLDEVKDFTDREIGAGYFSLEKLRTIFAATRKDGRSVSFVLLDDDNSVCGLRLSYPPGQWPERDKRQPVHSHLWKVGFEDAGYFQSLFLAPHMQKKGWGRRLSMASLEVMKILGARAVVAHSWDESPGNSSRKYLESVGFESVISIPEYWKCIDYHCTRCGKPCVCTATEMILYL